MLYPRPLTRFWIRQSLNKYSLICRVALYYVLYDKYSERCLLSKFQIYSGRLSCYWDISDIFTHFGIYLEPCVTLAYLEHCCIQNLGIFRIRYIQDSIKAYSGILRNRCNICILRILPYSELCHIQIFGMLRTRVTFRILFI